MALILCGITSCAVDTECRQDMRVRMGVSISGDSLRLMEDSVTYGHVSYSSVGPMTVYGEGSDSLMADSATVSTLYLPLRKDRDTCTYVFAFDGQEDTMEIYYTRKETFVSLACGCAVFATIDSVDWSTNALDSVKIINTAVTTIQETHLKLFFHKN